jgi:7-keto-8-aminopelargonate synthetase-like enzyme
MDYDAYFTDALARLHNEHRYRMFADLQRIAGRLPQAIWDSPQGPKNIVIWCSNDYHLGMGQHPKVIGAMVETATRMGTGEHCRQQSSAGRARARARRTAPQRSGFGVHLRLCLE